MRPRGPGWLLDLIRIDRNSYDFIPEDIAEASGATFHRSTDAARWLERSSAAEFKAPAGFEAYARILHPAFRGEGDDKREVTWAEVAAWSERKLRPTSSFEDIAYRSDGTKWDSVGRPPWEGEAFYTAPSTLVSLLREFTSTPQLCWCCLWVGYGGLDLRAVTTNELVHIFHDYLLFSGPLGNVPVLTTNGWSQGVSFWWPEDRAWCVVTDIDDVSTYVGGTRPCIERVLAEPTLEAFPASLDDHLRDDKT